ncbi:hypothetical protein GQ54DRAFT_298232 [Martensiomyces pterosporus]|nr:hypothetical protein GQ54DRAFT_298232 [Martensiomyces pterosporus]
MADLLLGGPDTSSSPLPPPPQLFLLEPIDVVDPWQQELVDCYHSLKTLTVGKSQVELHDTLQQKASESMRSHSDLVNGLVYGILTEPNECSTHFRNLNIVARDGFAHAVSRLQLLATAPKFYRLRPEVRAQVFWFLGELIKINTHGVDQVLIFLSRQMRSGDVTQSNVKLCRMVLNLLESNYDWLLNFPVLVATSVYAFGRLVLDHSRIPDLCKQESEFAVKLLRAKFTECSMIGRDLVRVLQDAAKVPAFRELWRDMVHSPHLVGAHFTGIEQLLRVPTPKTFLANRLTYEMEAKLLFILERLPFNGYSRNITWFAQRYLNTPESESLYCDLIRYICGVFHPSNAVLASNIVPRYVLLGSILRFIRSQVVAANAKLALFYDWLFYDPQVDNIMNVEPGVLIMVRSLDRYTYLTATFIEFLGYIADAYFPALAQAIRRSIGLTMKDAVEKGVIPSLVPIYEHPKVDGSTRRHMQLLFPQLLPSLSSDDQQQNGAGGETNGDEDEDYGVGDPLSFDYDVAMDSGEGTEDSIVPLTLNSAGDDSGEFGGEPQAANVVEAPPIVQPQPQHPPAMLPGLTTVSRPAVTHISTSPLVRDAAAEAGVASAGSGGLATSQPEYTPSPQPVVDPASLDPVSRMFAEDYAVSGENASLSLAASSAQDTSSGDMFASDLYNSMADASMPHPADEDDEDPEDVPLVASSSSDDEASSQPETANLDSPSLWLFGTSLQDFVTSMKSGNLDTAADSVREIVTVFAQSEAPTKSVAGVLASALADVEMEDIETNAELLAAGDSESVEHDMVHHIFAAMAPYMDDSTKEDARDRLLDLLVMLTESIVDVGFRWLLFCLAEPRRPHLYTLYVGRYSSGTMQAALSRDVHNLQERFNGLFYTILPDVYQAFPSSFPGCKAIVKSVVSLIDQPQVYRLNMLLATGQLRLFGARAPRVAGSTIEHDAFEQVCLWQLLAAEIAGDGAAAGRVARHLLVGKRLDPEANSEAANGLLSLLRTVPPSVDMLRTLATYMAGSGGEDTAADFCGSMLTSWLRVWQELLVKLVPTLVLDSGDLNGAAQKMVARWVDRFATRFGPHAMAICADIKEACKPVVTNASAFRKVEDDSEEIASQSSEIVVDNENDDGGSKDEEQGSRPTDDGSKKRRKPSSSSASTKAQGRRRSKRSSVQAAKRRRRNVITSDDEDEASSNIDEDGGNSSDLSSVSSVTSSSLSSSSLSSDDDDDDGGDGEF